MLGYDVLWVPGRRPGDLALHAAGAGAMGLRKHVIRPVARRAARVQGWTMRASQRRV